MDRLKGCPHILEKILFYLDGDSFWQCLYVCQQWRNLAQASHRLCQRSHEVLGRNTTRLRDVFSLEKPKKLLLEGGDLQEVVAIRQEDEFTWVVQTEAISR